MLDDHLWEQVGGFSAYPLSLKTFVNQTFSVIMKRSLQQVKCFSLCLESTESARNGYTFMSEQWPFRHWWRNDRVLGIPGSRNLSTRGELYESSARSGQG